MKIEPLRTRKVAEIVGIPLNTLKKHIARELVRPESFSGGGARGQDIFFEFHSVMEIAAAFRLLQLGIAPKTAYEVARVFALEGDSDAAWGGDEVLVRHPGLPYHFDHGRTFLCWNGEQSAVLLESETTSKGYRAVAFEGQMRLAGQYEDLPKHGPLKGHLLRDFPVAINVTEVFYETVGRLSLDPEKVLNEEYGRG